MPYRLSLTVLLLAILFGCKKNVDVSYPAIGSAYSPDSIDVSYGLPVDGGIYGVTSIFPHAYKMYYNKDGRINKFLGGGLFLVSASGTIKVFSTAISDSIIYVNKSQVTIQRKMLENFSAKRISPKQLFFFQNEKLTRKIIVDDFFSSNTSVETDTTDYVYDANGLLQFSTQYAGSTIKISNYYFDSRGDLVKISSAYKIKGDEDGEPKDSTIQTFGGYDDKKNPLYNSQFCLWDELFSRTLSPHNFTLYTYVQKARSGSIAYKSIRTWNLFYDANGVPDYGNFH